MWPINVKLSVFFYFDVENCDKDPKFKDVDHNFQNIKTFLRKVKLQISLKKFF